MASGLDQVGGYCEESGDGRQKPEAERCAKRYGGNEHPRLAMRLASYVQQDARGDGGSQEEQRQAWRAPRKHGEKSLQGAERALAWSTWIAPY